MAVFETASECLLDAWEACRPAKARLTWTTEPDYIHRYLFVVPDDESCRLDTFDTYKSSLLERFECTELLREGSCGVVEPANCERIESIETGIEGR